MAGATNEKQHYIFKPSAIDESMPVSRIGLPEWVNAATAFTKPKLDAAPAEDEQRFIGILEQQLESLATKLATDLNDLQTFQVSQLDFEQRTQKRLDLGHILIPDSNVGRAFTALRQADARNALIAQAAYAGIDVLSISASSMKGPKVLSAPTRGLVAGDQLIRTFRPPALLLSESAAAQLTAIVAREVAGKAAILDVAVDRNAKQMAEAEAKVAFQLAQAQQVKDQLTAELDITRERLSTLQETYRFEGSVKAAFAHWDAKAEQHRVRATKYLTAFLAIFGIWGLIFWCVFTKVVSLHTTIQEIPVAAPALLALLSVTGIWVGRLISRQYMSERHLAEDADERSALIRTFVSMLRDQEIGKEKTDVVLGALFRSAATGLLKDDASPTFPTEIFQKALDRAKS